MKYPLLYNPPLFQSMKDQLSRIQLEMSSITFNDSDSAENITDKLKGLEATRTRVKDLRDRLSKFEEASQLFFNDSRSNKTI